MSDAKIIRYSSAYYFFILPTYVILLFFYLVGFFFYKNLYITLNKGMSEECDA